MVRSSVVYLVDTLLTLASRSLVLQRPHATGRSFNCNTPDPVLGRPFTRHLLVSVYNSCPLPVTNLPIPSLKSLRRFIQHTTTTRAFADHPQDERDWPLLSQRSTRCRLVLLCGF